jgi:hypothetical protein
MLGMPLNAKPGSSYQSTPHSAEIVPRNKQPAKRNPTVEPAASDELGISESFSPPRFDQNFEQGIYDKPQQAPTSRSNFNFLDDISHLTEPSYLESPVKKSSKALQMEPIDEVPLGMFWDDGSHYQGGIDPFHDPFSLKDSEEEADWAPSVHSGENKEADWASSVNSGDGREDDWAASVHSGESKEADWESSVGSKENKESDWVPSVKSKDSSEADWAPDASRRTTKERGSRAIVVENEDDWEPSDDDSDIDDMLHAPGIVVPRKELRVETSHMPSSLPSASEMARPNDIAGRILGLPVERPSLELVQSSSTAISDGPPSPEKQRFLSMVRMVDEKRKLEKRLRGQQPRENLPKQKQRIRSQPMIRSQSPDSIALPQDSVGSQDDHKRMQEKPTREHNQHELRLKKEQFVSQGMPIQSSESVSPPQVKSVGRQNKSPIPVRAKPTTFSPRRVGAGRKSKFSTDRGSAGVLSASPEELKSNSPRAFMSARRRAQAQVVAQRRREDSQQPVTVMENESSATKKTLSFIRSKTGLSRPARSKPQMSALNRSVQVIPINSPSRTIASSGKSALVMMPDPRKMPHNEKALKRIDVTRRQEGEKRQRLVIDSRVVSVAMSVKRRQRAMLVDNRLVTLVRTLPKKVQWCDEEKVDYAKMDPIQRAGYRLLSKSAVPIQSAIRKYLARKEAVARLLSTIKIQTYFRRWRCESFLFAHQWGARKIQAAFHGWQTRDMLDEQRFCAIEIQRVVRGYFAAIRAYGSYRALTRLQSVIRGWLARKRLEVLKLHEMNEAAIRIQSMFRAFLSQLHFEFDVVDIIIAQSAVRRWKAYKVASKLRFGKQNEAATEIQRIWRGSHVYTNFIFSIADILVAQRTVRMWLAKRELRRRRLQSSATKIQAQWRQYSSQMTALYRLVHIIVVQSVGRRWLAARRARCVRLGCWAVGVIIGWWRIRHWRRQEKCHIAATKIQTMWRGFWGHSHYLIMNYEANRIQALFRGYRARLDANLKIGCAIIIQSVIRRFVAFLDYQERKMSLVIVSSFGLSIVQNTAARRIQRLWKYGGKRLRELHALAVARDVGIRQAAEKERAAKTIQRFFVMVKTEVDREIRRHEQAKATKKKLRKKEGKDSSSDGLDSIDKDPYGRRSTILPRGRFADAKYGKAHVAHLHLLGPNGAGSQRRGVGEGLDTRPFDEVSDVTAPTAFNRNGIPSRVTTVTRKEVSVPSGRQVDEAYLQRHGIQRRSPYEAQPGGAFDKQRQKPYSRPDLHSQQHTQHTGYHSSGQGAMNTIFSPQGQEGSLRPHYQPPRQESPSQPRYESTRQEGLQVPHYQPPRQPGCPMPQYQQPRQNGLSPSLYHPPHQEGQVASHFHPPRKEVPSATQYQQARQEVLPLAGQEMALAAGTFDARYDYYLGPHQSQIHPRELPPTNGYPSPNYRSPVRSDYTYEQLRASRPSGPTTSQHYAGTESSPQPFVVQRGHPEGGRNVSQSPVGYPDPRRGYF